MLDQRRRCWANIVQMFSKCFVFAGKEAYIDLHIYIFIVKMPQSIDILTMKNNINCLTFTRRVLI